MKKMDPGTFPYNLMNLFVEFICMNQSNTMYKQDNEQGKIFIFSIVFYWNLCLLLRKLNSKTLIFKLKVMMFIKHRTCVNGSNTTVEIK